MTRRALALLLLRPVVGACAEPPLVQPTLVEAGKLSWGTSPTFTPFEFMRDGQPAGFDVDLMQALGMRINLVPNMMAMDFKGIIPGLLGGRIDAGVSGMYVTPQRQEVADFIPYVRVGNQIVVQHGNPRHLDGPASLCGAKVAVPVSTAFEASAKQASAACVAAGRPEVDILSLPGSNVVALALSQGRVDAALNSTATIAAMMGEAPGAYALAGEPFDADTRIGIALRKDNPALKAALEGALNAMVADGSYAALLRKWHLPDQASVF